MQVWLLGVLKELSPTILFITHDVEEALFLCDRVYVLSECRYEVRLEVKLPFSKKEGALIVLVTLAIVNCIMK